MIFKKGIKAVKAALGATVGPAVEDLKAKFAAGSIPLQTDFSDLIDIADCGRKSVGQSPAQDGAPGNGILVDDAGKIAVKVKGQSGLAVSSDGVYFDLSTAFPAGTIIMFYSENPIPSGWHICNGENGTPNLIGRFIVGDSVNSNKFSGISLSTDGGLMGTTNSTGVEVEVEGASLLAEQLPFQKMQLIRGSMKISGVGDLPNTGSSTYTVPTLTTDNPYSIGSEDFVATTPQDQRFGDAHTHEASSIPHNHTVEVKVPYYYLIFIMKL
nr:hypothetical protein HUO10_005034 [Paraburkholderia busanensis]